MSSLVNDIKKKIKENPAGIFSLIYPYFLIIVVVVGLFYMSKLNFLSRQTVPPSISDTPEVKDLTLTKAKIIGAIDVNNIVKPADSLIQKGKSIFNTSCISCHGADGKGDGPVAAGLKPPPRNFTSSQGWINGAKLSQIYKTLQEGISGSAMASFSNFSPIDKIALTQYIRTSFVPNPPQDTPDDLKALDQTYNLSKGQKIPAQIPIADAMKLIEKETEPKYKKVLGILNLIAADSSSSSMIFKKVTNNKVKAITVLLNSTNWLKNEKNFVDIIVSNVNEDGFNEKVYELSASEWDALYNYMNKLF